MIPKNLTGQDLIRRLTILGYEIVRQKGSHIRIKTSQGGFHSETIPNHKPLRESTVNNILKTLRNILSFLNRI